jgi:hypothetical protein
MCDVGADRTDIRSQLHQTTVQSSTLVVTLFVLEEEGVVVQVNKLFSSTLHCQEISIYVFPEKEYPLHVFVSDLYIPTIGPPISLQQNRQTDRGCTDKSLTET